ncbi:MAG: NAD(P)H-hydrate dehydratase [archaeon]
MTQTTSLAQIKKIFKKRKPDSHKGQNGRVLVIGGSSDLVGAPGLAAVASLAALRAGTDLVTVLAPEKAGFAINSYSPDLIVKKVSGKFFAPKHMKKAIELAEKADAIVIGMGIGKEKASMRFCREFVKKNVKPIVIDADALRACKGMKLKGNAIITPHQNEFLEFTGKKIADKNPGEKIILVKEAAKKHNCVILLKAKTPKYANVVSDGKSVSLNNTGNAGMTKGGTGDVLAGLCGAYIALGAKPLEAARAAAFVNGKIGDELKNEMGYGFVASDFAKKIPNWTKKIFR